MAEEFTREGRLERGLDAPFGLAFIKLAIDLAEDRCSHVYVQHTGNLVNPSADIRGHGVDSLDQDAAGENWERLDGLWISVGGEDEDGSTVAVILFFTPKVCTFKVAGDDRTEVLGISVRLQERLDEYESVLEADERKAAANAEAAAKAKRARRSHWWENDYVQAVVVAAAVLGIISFALVVLH